MDIAYVKHLIEEEKVIAIMRDINQDNVIDVVGAILDGGISLFEIAFDHEDKDTVKKTSKIIEVIKKHFGNKICIGFGTVLSIKEAERAIQLGAEYIISPNVNIDLIKKVKSLNKISIPGALTSTEAVRAYEAGADYIKLFPASNLGANYVKAILESLEHIPFIAVGGITPDNIKGFLDVGMVAAGIGGQLVREDIIRNKEYIKLTTIAESITKRTKE